MPDVAMLWTDWLRVLLCKLFQSWGGNCETLFPPQPSGWIAMVTDAYNANGAPTFTDLLEKQQFLELLDALDAHLKLPDNSLSASDNNKLLSLIAALRAALGGP